MVKKKPFRFQPLNTRGGVFVPPAHPNLREFNRIVKASEPQVPIVSGIRGGGLFGQPFDGEGE